jgi:hypothetical protein
MAGTRLDRSGHLTEQPSTAGATRLRQTADLTAREAAAERPPGSWVVEEIVGVVKPATGTGRPLRRRRAARKAVADRAMAEASRGPSRRDRSVEA